MTQAGWYTDPENPNAQRWWDGNAWGPPGGPPPQQAPQQPDMGGYQQPGMQGGYQQQGMQGGYQQPGMQGGYQQQQQGMQGGYGWTPPPAAAGPVDAVKACLNKYATFQGRASRSEFWWFYGALIVASVALNVLSTVLPDILSAFAGIVLLVVSLGALVPNIAVAARRLHDLGQSAWLLLLFLVPCVNLGMLIYLMFPGQPGPNQYDVAS